MENDIKKKILNFYMYSFIISYPLLDFSMTIMYIEICKSVLEIEKIQGIQNLLISISIIIASFIWEKYNDKVFKNAYILNILNTSLDILLCICYMCNIINILAFSIYIRIIWGFTDQIFNKSIFRAQNIVFKKKELDLYNNKFSSITSICSIISAFLLIVFKLDTKIAIGITFMLGLLIERTSEFLILISNKELLYKEE